jgi:transposase
MAQAITLRGRDSVAELRQQIKESHDDAQKARIRAIINIKEGATRVDVAKRFVVDTDSITAWVKAYNKGGTAALKMNRGGRPEGNPKWDTTIFDALAKEIDTKKGYWSIPKMQEWITFHHKKDIPEQTVWYRMDKLNYSYKSARPHPVQGNREKQEAFKKGVSFHSLRH